MPRRPNIAAIHAKDSTELARDRPSRFFWRLDSVTACVEWFIWTREGVIGGYPSRELAECVLASYIELCRLRNARLH